jgi:hypothetical protein
VFVSIRGDVGLFLGPVAGCITVVALLSVLRAENMPERGRIVLYGLTILAILRAYGRERRHHLILHQAPPVDAVHRDTAGRHEERGFRQVRLRRAAVR